MKKIIRHAKPGLWKRRQLIAVCRRLLKDEPESESNGYRRGILHALQWVAGENAALERERKKKARRVLKKP